MSDVSAPICRACNVQPLDTRVERSRGLCDPCAEETGLWLEPPSIRPTRPCQRCGHTQFVASQLRERGADRMTVLPFGIALAHAGAGFVTSQTAHPWAPMGILIAFACRACGLTELYTLEADKIPIGPEHGTHLVDYSPVDGPLR
jgi:predicted nucleic-acid-binding Zn-ribbon protein